MTKYTQSVTGTETGGVVTQRMSQAGVRTMAVPWWRRKSIARRAKLTFVLFLLLCGSVIYLMPFFWVLSTALKTPPETVRYPLVIIPAVPQWKNFVKAWTTAFFARSMLNSLIVSVISAAAEVVVTSLAGYSFARLRWPGRNKVFVLVLLSMMLPHQITMIPKFVLFARLGWVNTYWPLIVPHFGGTAFLVFLMRQFMMSIPRDLDDAAKIDGCGPLSIWWRIMLPLCKPAVATVAIFSFLESWRAFVYPLLYLNSPRKWTVMLAISSFNIGEGGVIIHLRMAAALISLIPPLIVFFLAQKQFIRGIALTGMRG